MKKTVQALIFNENKEILAVSRKTDHADFGLAGGKVDDEDYGSLDYPPLMAALVREVKEETGLDIDADSAELVFAIHKDGYMGYTYLIKSWSGEISTDEPHVVKFTNFQEIINGSFGRYNSLVAESLTDLGFEFKMYPDPHGEYIFRVYDDDINAFDGQPYFCISPKVDDPAEDGVWNVGHWPEGMWEEIMVMFGEDKNFEIERHDQECFTLKCSGLSLTSIHTLADLLNNSGFFTNRVDSYGK